MCRRLKRSWAICDGNLSLRPPVKSARAVLACFCLHNYQSLRGDLDQMEDDNEGECEIDEEAVEPGAEAMAGIEWRDAHVAEYFA